MSPHCNVIPRHVFYEAAMMRLHKQGNRRKKLLVYKNPYCWRPSRLKEALCCPPVFKTSHYIDEIGSIWWGYFFFNFLNSRFFFSSFHSFRREVTKQALFTEKPSFQSLPRLNAPRNKPNFSCCNWVRHRTRDTAQPALKRKAARY